mmetsp:Transcript_20884/g.39199  ORF Transcript_20884/g.39199 Transcript_20884/m.39199 type:complete len:222 (+) Transcript_20884:845-1510(+)
MVARSSFTSSLLRVCFTLSKRAIWLSRTFVLSMANTSTRSSFSNLYLLTPTITSLPESIRACLRAAASSIRNLGMPESTAFAMPPISSISAIISFALATKSSVRASIMYDPPKGSTTLGIKASSWSMSCVLRAILAENSVGRPMASSNEFVWRLWVPPRVAARASTVVRTTLLCGSCSVSDHPEVWQWVRRSIDFSFLGLKFSLISSAHNTRAALSLAISM